MALRILGERLGRQALAVLAVCGVCVATTAMPGEAATVPLPVKMVTEPNPNMPDPGVLLNNNKFYAFTTGAGLQESTSSIAAGPWSTPANALSGGLPSWADGSVGVWAPDMIETTSGQFVVYFSAALAGIPAGSPSGNDAAPASGARCIGTAESQFAAGPFTVDPNPLVCLTGHGASDDMTTDPANRVLGEGVIDASPVFVTIGGAQELFLVYKTQAVPSTIRMVRLADNDGTSVLGDSHQLVFSSSETIEAPSLIQNGSYFVLFVAHGNYKACSYSTEWFKSQHIWSWTNTGATTLLDTSSGLCGPGSADVSASEVSGQDRIFFHGWVRNGTNTPATAANSPTGISEAGTSAARRVMYAAVLTFASDGFTPVIGAYQGQ
jgi:arabinan endo-1,5-alpha-L-arabinosidase